MFIHCCWIWHWDFYLLLMCFPFGFLLWKTSVITMFSVVLQVCTQYQCLKRAKDSIIINNALRGGLALNKIAQRPQSLSLSSSISLWSRTSTSVSSSGDSCSESQLSRMFSGCMCNWLRPKVYVLHLLV